jgi:transposase
LINKRWTPKHKKKGRPQVTKSIKNLILETKQDNRLWGCRKISDELKKVGIVLHHTTVNKIFRLFGKIVRLNLLVLGISF